MDVTTTGHVLFHDWDNEIDIAPPFVGRQHDLRLLEDAIDSRFRLFGVVGTRSVGKSRLVKELLTRYVTGGNLSLNQVKVKNTTINREEIAFNDIPTIIRVDLEHQSDINAIRSNLCACLGEKPDGDDSNDESWVMQIVRIVKARKNKQYIFFFDNLENSENNCQLNEDLVALFLELTSKCVHVKVFITSTTNFMTSLPDRIYFCHELQPLTPTESAELFRVIAPNVEFGSYEGPIVKLSEGLPLLISMIANEMADDRGMITPKEMLELLATSRLKCLSRHEFYAREDCVADVYKTFIERLHTIYRQRLAVLGFIPGSFDVREAKGILGYEFDEDVKDQALIPIRRRYMLNYDPITRRYNIQGILRECLQVFFAVRNIAEVRKRYCEVFAGVMLEISEKLGTEEYVKALSQFSLEQPNFQKLMTEVYNTTEDTYHFFITMATKCTDLMEQFMLKECVPFYNGCLLMADRYGNTIDKAMVNIAVGSMWTNAKGELQKGAEQYKLALNVLVTKGNRWQLATVYQRMGWNLHRQGRNVEAVGFFDKTLKIAQCGEEKLQRLALQSLNSLGLSNTILGQFEDAERYLLGALKKAKAMYSKDHPAIGITLNNIGVYYETKGDSENALKYYNEGLDIKKRNKAPATSIVISMTNVANGYNNLRNYDKAHELLDEGIQLIHQQKVPAEAVLALAYDTKGKVLMSQKRYGEASTMFDKSADIGQLLAPEGITYAESLVHLAVAKQRLGKHKACIKTATKAIELKTRAVKIKPQKSFIADCYECLAQVYQHSGNGSKYLETLELLEDELCRLEQVHICSCNETMLEVLRQQLDDIRNKINVVVQERSTPKDS